MKCVENMHLPKLIRPEVQSDVKIMENMSVLTVLPSPETLLLLIMKFLKFHLKFSGCFRKVRFVNNFNRKRTDFLFFFY